MCKSIVHGICAYVHCMVYVLRLQVLPQATQVQPAQLAEHVQHLRSCSCKDKHNIRRMVKEKYVLPLNRAKYSPDCALLTKL